MTESGFAGLRWKKLHLYAAIRGTYLGHNVYTMNDKLHIPIAGVPLALLSMVLQDSQASSA